VPSGSARAVFDGAMTDLIVRAGRIVTPSGEQDGSVQVRAGRIRAITGVRDMAAGATVLDVPDDQVVLPGLVDTHVHINEPGRTEWEGFATATAAAAAGGVTTVVDMPLNSIPPTVGVDALAVKRSAAHGKVTVDVAFWGGAVPDNLDELAGLHDAGVVGFKCFLLPSGVDEFGYLDRVGLVAAMRKIADFGGLLIAHAEDPDVIAAAPAPDGRGYRRFEASRPPGAESAAIDWLLDGTRETGCRTHIVHLSSADALPAVARAKAERLPVTVETCPHYLTLCAEQIPDGATQFKCCPPIRGAANRERLWDALGSGLVDFVVSDHSPSTIELKRLDSGDFEQAWGGISSLQLGLALIWTEAYDRGYQLTDVMRWMAERPARLAGLPGKGTLAVGSDADFSIFDPDGQFIVEAASLRHRNPITPYAGSRLRGVVHETWLRGARIDASSPRGRLLRRGVRA